jgi:hypothetical protein
MSDDDKIGRAQSPDTLGIIVNTAFAERIGEEGVARYVAVLESAAAVARDGGAAADVEEHLRSRLADAGIGLAEPRYGVLADQLVQLAVTGGPLSVSLDDGTVLAGPALVVPGSVPAEQGAPDPEATERPTYS